CCNRPHASRPRAIASLSVLLILGPLQGCAAQPFMAICQLSSVCQFAFCKPCMTPDQPCRDIGLQKTFANVETYAKSVIIDGVKDRCLMRQQARAVSPRADEPRGGLQSFKRLTPTFGADMSDDDWKDDLLDGAEKIQALLEHENVSRTYYMLRKKCCRPPKS